MSKGKVDKVETSLDLKKEVSLAYLAGFIEGEGSIGVERLRGPKNNHHAVFISAVNTNPWVLAYLQFVFGGSLKRKKRRENRWGDKPCYVWSCSCKKAETALRAIYPYLFMKKKQAKLCLILRNIRYISHFHGHRGQLPLRSELFELREKIARKVHDLTIMTERVPFV